MVGPQAAAGVAADVAASVTADLAPAAQPDTARRKPGFGLAGRAGVVAFSVWLVMQAVEWVLFQSGSDQPASRLDQLGVAVSGACVAAFGAWLLARGLVRRLEQLGAAVARLQGGDYRHPIGLHAADDELGALAGRLDRMREAIAERENRILNLALYDSLTGLPNRTLLIDRIGLAVRDAQRYKREFALLLMDLDRFKLVNDTLGHAVGDEMLKEVARRVGLAVRDSDTVARLGGDEFVVLLTGGLDLATEIAGRILTSLQEPMRFGTDTIDLGASIGVSCYPAHGQDVEMLMRSADIAMYRAKRDQSGFVVFDGTDREFERSHLSMLGEMRKALERNEFTIDWQPRLALSSGRIVGAEGLVRWNHPARGRLGPADFIPFAEETGFVREITRWVIKTGVAQAAQFSRDGLDLHVSLNVSALDIQHRQFASDVQRALQSAQLDARALSLEITESGVVSDLEHALATLRSIAELGVRLSVDDFGTGYATLSQLQQLPMHELKIDRSFVCGLCDNRGSEAIVRATIDLARKLGLKVTAEGVETGRELKALQALGCDEAQGFYIAKPMPAAELTTWVRRRHASRLAASRARAVG